jgi:hypothetical protein
MTLDASTRPTASPIVRILNEEVRHHHRWCTPSTLVDQRIEDFYASDVSISAGFFGTLVDHTGVFGEAERFGAAALGADRTMLSVTTRRSTRSRRSAWTSASCRCPTTRSSRPCCRRASTR